MTRVGVLTIAALMFGFVLVGCQVASESAPPTSRLAPGPAERASHWTRTSIGKFADPYGVGVDVSCTANCDVYVADPGAATVWKVRPDGSRQAIGTFPAGFDPQGVAVGLNGEVLVADKVHGYWRVLPDGSTHQLRGPSNYPNYPRAVAADPLGDVYVDIATRHPGLGVGSVYPIVGSQASTHSFGTLSFGNPYGIAIDPTGKIAFIVDPHTATLYRRRFVDQKPYHWDFTHIATFVDPYGVAIDPRNLHVYVADAGAKKVFAVSPSGIAEVGTFTDPYGVAVDAHGTLYVADAGSKDVWKLTP